MNINRFNIRVYGLLLNDKQEILLIRELIANKPVTKFPGGGLEFGEGLKDGLVREYKEETGLEVEVVKHLYTTDFFQQSAFKETDQLISVYYLVTSPEAHRIRLDLHEITNGEIVEQVQFFWVKLDELSADQLTFPVDKLVCGMLANNLVSLSDR